MELSFSHPVMQEANRAIMERTCSVNARAEQKWLTDYTEAGDFTLSFPEVLAGKLRIAIEVCVLPLIRNTPRPLIDPRMFIPPKREQYFIEGLPVFALSESPYGSVTLVSCVPFYDVNFPVQLFQRLYKVPRLHFTICTPATLNHLFQRMQGSELLRPLTMDEAIALADERKDEPAIRLAEVLAQQKLMQNKDELSLEEFLEKLKASKPPETNPEALTAWTCLALDIPYLSMDGVRIGEITGLNFSAALQRKFEVCPFGRIGKALTFVGHRQLLMRTKTDIGQSLAQGDVVQYILARKGDVTRLTSSSETRSVASDSLAERVIVETTVGAVNAPDRIDVQQIHARTVGRDNGASVVDLVNGIMVEAISKNATDIHISEHPDRMLVRFRIDGRLYEPTKPFSRDLTRQVIARVKIMGYIDTQFSHLPQDGKASIDVAGQVFDIRIATANTVHGEKAVLRLLPKQSTIPSFESRGFGEHEIQVIKQTLDADYGLLVVCGPTGAGKSSTLYSAMGYIDRRIWNVVTAEEPVEIKIPFVEQTEIKKGSGMTFGRAVEAFLRHDPDYIMIGETRDADTAEQVVRAANTGHVVLTTLHTNSAAAAASRLIDLGVEPYLLKDALTAVCAQRLIPRVCPNCATRGPIPGSKELKAMGIDPKWMEGANHLYEANGCSTCHQSGYLGRFAIMEAYSVDATIRDLILTGGNMQVGIHNHQIAQGGKPLFEQAIAAAAAGLTTLKGAAVRGGGS